MLGTLTIPGSITTNGQVLAEAGIKVVLFLWWRITDTRINKLWWYKSHTGNFVAGTSTINDTLTVTGKITGRF